MKATVDGIVLAAGYSSRAHKFKMGLPIGGMRLLERTIDSMSEVCNKIIVVTGHNQEKVEEIIESIPKVVSCYNPKYERGMFTSVKRGAREVTGERFFMIPGDQPLVKPNTYEKMLEVDAEIVSPRCNGKKGHPVLFNSNLIPDLLKIPDDGILRDFIHEIGAVCQDVDDQGIHLDVDTKEDYAKILKYFQKVYNVR